ncbi:MAG: hypothetical protein K2L38_13625, partial [Dysosmobacter sp.]|nr:hypothetical protein [Dysosmobacter sp.]
LYRLSCNQTAFSETTSPENVLSRRCTLGTTVHFTDLFTKVKRKMRGKNLRSCTVDVKSFFSLSKRKCNTKRSQDAWQLMRERVTDRPAGTGE